MDAQPRVHDAIWRVFRRGVRRQLKRAVQPQAVGCGDLNQRYRNTVDEHSASAARGPYELAGFEVLLS
jgi:hypothetical protein